MVQLSKGKDLVGSHLPGLRHRHPALLLLFERRRLLRSSVHVSSVKLPLWRMLTKQGHLHCGRRPHAVSALCLRTSSSASLRVRSPKTCTHLLETLEQRSEFAGCKQNRGVGREMARLPWLPKYQSWYRHILKVGSHPVRSHLLGLVSLKRRRLLVAGRLQCHALCAQQATLLRQSRLLLRGERALRMAGRCARMGARCSRLPLRRCGVWRLQRVSCALILF